MFKCIYRKLACCCPKGLPIKNKAHKGTPFQVFWIRMQILVLGSSGLGAGHLSTYLQTAQNWMFPILLQAIEASHTRLGGCQRTLLKSLGAKWTSAVGGKASGKPSSLPPMGMPPLWKKKLSGTYYCEKCRLLHKPIQTFCSFPEAHVHPPTVWCAVDNRDLFRVAPWLLNSLPQEDCLMYALLAFCGSVRAVIFQRIKLLLGLLLILSVPIVYCPVIGNLVLLYIDVFNCCCKCYYSLWLLALV